MPGEAGMTTDTPEQATSPQPVEAKPVEPDYKALYNGLNGNFKQLKADRDTIARQFAEVTGRLQTIERASAERATEDQEDASLRELERLVEGDPVDLQESVRQKVSETKAQRRERQRLQALYDTQVIPQVRKQATEDAQRMYFAGVAALAEKVGLSTEEVQAIGQEAGGKFDEFFVKFGEKAVGKKVSEAQKAQKDELDQMRASILEEVKAQFREKQPSPDTGGTGGGTKTYNSFTDLEAGWLAGEVKDSDYRAARKEHGLR